jgi:TFIIF-interacting CTD phosphatase-like protein
MEQGDGSEKRRESRDKRGRKKTREESKRFGQRLSHCLSFDRRSPDGDTRALCGVRVKLCWEEER